MKRLTTILLALLISFAGLSQTNYYVKNGGNDGNTGLSDGQAWENISKVNTVWAAGTFNPGDFILFKRGSTFRGTITVTESGTEGNEITVGAYDSGDDPIIIGFETIAGWANEGGGIYSKVIASEDNKVEMLTIDGIQYGMGRYPNSTYLTYESFSTNVSITDDELPADPDWTGAEVVIRKNDWTLDRADIDDHTLHTLTYTSLGSSSNGINDYGYFIQNDIRCVTNFGEWFYDGSELFVFFGGETPGDYTVKIATLDNLLYNENFDYITIDGINFIGSNAGAVSLGYWNSYSLYNSIINCNFDFAGSYGIYLPEGSDYALINNNNINHSGSTGIWAGGGTDMIFTNNTIQNSGLILGVATDGSLSDGILADNQTGAFIQYNNIVNSAYNGIYFIGNDCEVRNNFINYSCLLLDDGAGIYTSSNYTGRIIDGNIVLNSIGNINGTTQLIVRSRGIYLDEFAADIEVTNNTAAHCAEGGFMLHKAHDVILTGNTSFNNFYGIFFQNTSGGQVMINNVVEYNLFVAKTPTQFALRWYSGVDLAEDLGTADNNYYARPIDDDDTFIYPDNQENTLAEWQAYTSLDANSDKSPCSIDSEDELHFIYNATNSNKLFTLSSAMIDVANVSYSGTISLEPWTSLILIGVGTVKGGGGVRVLMSGNRVLIRNGKVMVRY